MAEKTLTIEEYIQELESEALSLAKKGGALDKETASEDMRNVLRRLFARRDPPNPETCNKLALFMLNWYSKTDLSHNHSGEVVDVKSIKEEWARKALVTLASKISFSWQLSRPEEVKEAESPKPVDTKNVSSSDQQLANKEVKTMSESNGKMARRLRREGSWKERALTNGKAAVTRAMVRKAARNLSMMGQQGVVMLLESNNDLDSGFKTQIRTLLATDVGRGLLAFALSAAVDHLPIPGLSDDTKESLILELQTEAVDSATAPVEKIIQQMVPMLTASLSPLLTGGSDSEVKQMKGS